MQKELELHIQKLPSSANSIKLFNELEQGSVSIRMPKGTGFAQMKSMIELSLAKSDHKDIYLYWGARSPEGFYMPNLPIHWASPHFHYHPVVSDALDEDSWKGRQGLLFEAVIDDKDSVVDSEVFISGSPQMVYATFDALVAENFKAEYIHSDVFEYAPRS
ncbi:hypothetical protein CAPTEDRAFT_215654 [Capitella teleta]|uniref:Oxidoreductase FAD/NAD(P)-binding domain-containing protein n=1 Tax=Capitella teleta TaxID=283909 RepID=R7U267_CAPTE|nr:hypothetical protein CAPTEDRAFT_215654 [Capitella teleta]|eukprot:ELT99972.1 hypothetical protein CAPTEDRAFT_215654 [Capitella teleta]